MNMVAVDILTEKPSDNEPGGKHLNVDQVKIVAKMPVQYSEHGADAAAAEEATEAAAPADSAHSKRPKDRVKRSVAIHTGYVGTGYKGSSINRTLGDDVTIEQVLEKALFAAGCISEANFGSFSKVKWSRASRTDKGVHSLATVMGLRMLVDDSRYAVGPEGDVEGLKLADSINQHLPPQIRVFTVQKTNKKFSARHRCEERVYQYYLPASMIDLKCDGSEEDAARLAAFRDALACFQGCHPFHNYTRRQVYQPGGANVQYRPGRGASKRIRDSDSQAFGQEPVPGGDTAGVTTQPPDAAGAGGDVTFCPAAAATASTEAAEAPPAAVGAGEGADGTDAEMHGAASEHAHQMRNQQERHLGEGDDGAGGEPDAKRAKTDDAAVVAVTPAAEVGVAAEAEGLAEPAGVGTGTVSGRHGGGGERGAAVTAGRGSRGRGKRRRRGDGAGGSDDDEDDEEEEEEDGGAGELDDDDDEEGGAGAAAATDGGVDCRAGGSDEPRRGRYGPDGRVVVVQWQTEIDPRDRVMQTYYRRIHHFTASDPKPLLEGGTSCLLLEVRGQSFMLHHIRHMIGGAVAVALGLMSKDMLMGSMQPPARVTVPRAPPHTLLLADCAFGLFPQQFGVGDNDLRNVTGERLSVRAGGLARREEFRERVLLPALQHLVDLPEWNQWKASLYDIYPFPQAAAELFVSSYLSFKDHKDAVKRARQEQQARRAQEGGQEEKPEGGEDGKDKGAGGKAADGWSGSTRGGDRSGWGGRGGGGRGRGRGGWRVGGRGGGKH
ncbi:hypothetical protein VaNZ11_001288 [Volvox africanus]|uniref:Pseudouridine synthase I TruA alpha/beta domain-containing protein n=1 Tax=Volvox africanus TaxID=51714 RepID=A0ABQ5RPF0_9CHLO|nr:hypothetical protein VaNZ11_001288 [Volvox africanus]